MDWITLFDREAIIPMALSFCGMVLTAMFAVTMVRSGNRAVDDYFFTAITVLGLLFLVTLLEIMLITSN